MIGATLKCGIAALLLLHTNAMADNHIFFHGSPMVTVKTKGGFEAFELSEYSDEGHAYVKPEIERAVQLLYAPGNSSGIKVEGFRIDPGIGCIEPDRVLLVDSTSTDGVLSTRPLPRPRFPGTQSANLSQLEQARPVLQKVLKTIKKLSKSDRTLLSANAVVNVARLDTSGKVSFIIESEVDVNRRKGLSMLAILTSGASGRLVATYSDIRKGTASDSDGYAGSQTLIDHIDLDGDGLDEIFIAVRGYESSEIKVFTRHRQGWAEVATGGAAGC